MSFEVEARRIFEVVCAQAAALYKKTGQQSSLVYLGLNEYTFAVAAVGRMCQFHATWTGTNDSETVWIMGHKVIPVSLKSHINVAFDAA